MLHCPLGPLEPRQREASPCRMLLSKASAATMRDDPEGLRGTRRTPKFLCADIAVLHVARVCHLKREFSAGRSWPFP